MSFSVYIFLISLIILQLFRILLPFDSVVTNEYFENTTTGRVASSRISITPNFFVDLAEEIAFLRSTYTITELDITSL